MAPIAFTFQLFPEIKITSVRTILSSRKSQQMSPISSVILSFPYLLHQFRGLTIPSTQKDRQMSPI